MTLGAMGARAAAKPERMRAAVIGCRNRGHQVATSFLRSGQFDIATLCDCDQSMFDGALSQLKKTQADISPKLEQDFRRVLDDPGIDAVVVATPDHWHALITAMALDAGKHVYVEKPASYNLADGQAMVAAQNKHPELVVQVGTQQRSGQHFADAKAFIDAGELGTIGFCRAWITHRRHIVDVIPDSDPPATLDYDMWLGPAPKRPYNENRVHYNWHFFRDYGTGEMGNWGAHWLDIARWFLGIDFPKSVAGLGGVYVVHDAKEWPDTQTVLYEYPALTLLWEQRLWTRYPVSGASCGVEFSGDKGALFIDRGGWTFFPSEGEPVKHPGSGLDVAHAENFAQAIRGEAKPNASMEEGHKSAVLCHLGNIAATLNRSVLFDAATQSFPNDAEARALTSREYRSPWQAPA